jgi:hypothetical protein
MTCHRNISITSEHSDGMVGHSGTRIKSLPIRHKRPRSTDIATWFHRRNSCIDDSFSQSRHAFGHGGATMRKTNDSYYYSRPRI